MKAPDNLSLRFGRILSAFAPQIAAQKIRLIAGMTFFMFGAFMDVLQPWPLQYLFDHVFGRGRRLASRPMLQGLNSRTVSQVDRVVYLREGQIVEEGAPEEFIAGNGRYAAACRLHVAGDNSTGGLYAEA